MQRIARAVADATPGLLREGLGLCGGALVAYGAWIIYEPAGLIVGGMALVAYAILLARAASE